MGAYDVFGEPADLGTIVYSDGTRYPLDWNDVVWLARALTAENPLGWDSSPVAISALRSDYVHKGTIAWMLAQRKYALPALRPLSIPELVRQWSGPLHPGHARFPLLSTASWDGDGGKQLPLDARAVALDWALGRLPNFIPGVVDSGTLREPGGLCSARTPRTALVRAPYAYAVAVGRAGCNGFFAFGPGYGTTRWSGHEVYVVGPGGLGRSGLGGYDRKTAGIYASVLTGRALPVGRDRQFDSIPSWA